MEVCTQSAKRHILHQAVVVIVVFLYSLEVSSVNARAAANITYTCSMDGKITIELNNDYTNYTVSETPANSSHPFPSEIPSNGTHSCSKSGGTDVTSISLINCTYGNTVCLYLMDIIDVPGTTILGIDNLAEYTLSCQLPVSGVMANASAAVYFADLPGDSMFTKFNVSTPGQTTLQMIDTFKIQTSDQLRMNCTVWACPNMDCDNTCTAYNIPNPPERRRRSADGQTSRLETVQASLRVLDKESTAIGTRIEKLTGRGRQLTSITGAVMAACLLAVTLM